MSAFAEGSPPDWFQDISNALPVRTRRFPARAWRLTADDLARVRFAPESTSLVLK